MEERENIDEQFRSSLENAEIEPSEKVWSSLDAQLEKKSVEMRNKKRKRFLWLFFLLMLVGFGGYEYFAPSENKLASSDNHPVLPVVKTDIPFIDDHVKSETEPASAINQSSEKTSSAKEESTKSSSAEKSAEHLSNSAAKTSYAVTQPAQGDYYKDSRAEKIKKKAKNINENIYAEKQKMDLQKHEVKVTGIDNAETAVVSNTAKEAGNITSTLNPQNNENKPEMSVADKQQKVAAEEPANNKSDEKVANDDGNKTKSGEINTAHELKGEIMNSSAFENPAPTKPEENNQKAEDSQKTIAPLVADVATPVTNKTDSSAEKNNGWKKRLLKKIASGLSLDIYYSPNYAMRTLKADKTYVGSNAEKTQAEYYSNEKPDFSFSTGLRIRYDLSKKFSVSTGCSYSTFAQSAISNTIYVQSDSVYEEEHNGHAHEEDEDEHEHGHGHGNHGQGGQSGDNDDHYVVHTSCGDIDLDNAPETSGSVQNGDSLNILTETNQLIQFINVPLTVRFQVKKNKLTYYAETGMAANFVIKNEVKVTVNNVYLETNTVDGVKKMNYSFLFSAGVQYRFFKMLNVFVEPSLRYSVTPVNQNNPVKSYPYFLGVNTGLALHF